MFGAWEHLHAYLEVRRMGRKGKKITIAAALLTVLLAVPSTGLGQDGGDTGELQYPRNNVKKGAVSARRPGAWINRAASTHVERQNTMLKDFGGATPIPEDQEEPSRRQVMMLAFLEGLFDFLNQLAEQLLLAIEASKLAESST